jgi:hypothetical protein
MFEYPVTYCVISQVASYKHQKQLETRIKVHEEEKKVLITMNQELEGIKVSVAYIHQGHSIIRSYYFWHATGSSKCKFSACYVASGLSFKNNLSACY